MLADNLVMFQEHFEYVSELRSKLFSVLIFFAIGALVSFLFGNQLIVLGLKLFNLQGVNIVMTSPFQFIGLSFTISITCGIIAALPVFLYQVLKFVKPALHQHEYKMILKLLPWSLLLFILGFSFGVWIMRYVVLIYASVAKGFQVGNFWDIQKLFDAVFMTATLLGLIFEFPIICTLLLRFHFMKRQSIAKKRIYIYGGIILFVTMLPPTDIFSDLLLAVPLLLLFELTLLLNRSYA
ncbi:MAG TPA: twin-arginine translocase subunit TatC [Patescibacteria group bacterium]|nr:twin-arginine translocase subunit TatC [Patescibacteria group bacterium]